MSEKRARIGYWPKRRKGIWKSGEGVYRRQWGSVFAVNAVRLLVEGELL